MAKQNQGKANSDTVSIAVIASQVSDIKDNVNDIKTKLESDYITRVEFDPVKKVVYGMVGLVLIAVIGALLILVIKK